MATKSTKSRAAKAAKKSAGAAKKSAKVSASKSAAIPQKQMQLPASFKADGTEMATLREVLDPNVPTVSLAELTPEQRADLVAKPIEAQPKFQVAMVGVGVVDK